MGINKTGDTEGLKVADGLPDSTRFDIITAKYAPQSFGDLKELARRADTTRTLASTAVRQTESVIQQDQNLIHKRLETFRGDARKHVLNAEMERHSEWKRKHLNSSRESRWEPLKELQALKEGAAAVKGFYAQPRNVLLSYKAGSQRRANIENSLKGLPKSAIAAMGDRAVIEKDSEMAAAILAVETGKAREDRAIRELAQFAEIFMGAECARALELIKTVEESFASAYADVKRLENGGHESPTEKLARGIRQGQMRTTEQILENEGAE